MQLLELFYTVVYYIVLFLFLNYVYYKLVYRPCRSAACLVGKTAIVTGGNRGIGLQTVIGLAARGCRVIIAARSKADQVKNDVIERTHNPNIIVKHLDLKSLASVREFCKEIHDTEEKIDILIHNAGIGVDTLYKVYTKDGLDPIMQTNLFGPFLMTHLLVDLLKKADHARIIFVSALMAFNNDLTLDNLNPPEGEEISVSSSFRIYGNSKFGQIILCKEFAEKLRSFGITSNAVHPGFVPTTDIFIKAFEVKALPTFADVIFKVATFLYARSPREAAQSILAMAMSNKFKHVTETFMWYINMAPFIAKDKDFRRRLWKKIEEYVKLSDDEKILYES